MLWAGDRTAPPLFQPFQAASESPQKYLEGRFLFEEGRGDEQCLLQSVEAWPLPATPVHGPCIPGYPRSSSVLAHRPMPLSPLGTLRCLKSLQSLMGQISIVPLE